MDTAETYITPWFKAPKAQWAILIEVRIYDRQTDSYKVIWKGGE